MSPDADGVYRVRAPGFVTAAVAVEKLLATGAAMTVEVYIGEATDWAYRATQPETTPWNKGDSE